jgi:hypothetical protein
MLFFPAILVTFNANCIFSIVLWLGDVSFLKPLHVSEVAADLSHHIVACLLKARIVKLAETATAREGLCKHACC